MRTPLDLLAPEPLRDARLATCRACDDHFAPATQQCRLCHCVMPLKTWLKAARCPAGLWDGEA